MLCHATRRTSEAGEEVCQFKVVKHARLQGKILCHPDKPKRKPATTKFSKFACKDRFYANPEVFGSPRGGLAPQSCKHACRE